LLPFVLGVSFRYQWSLLTKPLLFEIIVHSFIPSVSTILTSSQYQPVAIFPYQTVPIVFFVDPRVIVSQQFFAFHGQIRHLQVIVAVVSFILPPKLCVLFPSSLPPVVPLISFSSHFILRLSFRLSPVAIYSIAAFTIVVLSLY